MAGITGVGSGIDIKSIVDVTVAAERAPKDAQLKRLTDKTTTQITSLGTFKSALSEFQTAAKNLNDASLFGTRKATSSDAARITASAEKTALTGTYRVEVAQLATASKIASGSVSGDSSSTFASGGTLTIGLGSDSFDVDVAAGATLKDIRDAINTKLGEKGISANIVSDPAGGTSQLVLSSDKTGAGKDLTLAATGADLQGLVTDMPAALSQAQNAKFKIDGLALESATNEVSGAIEGVSFTLVKAEEGVSTTLTVGENSTAVKDNLKKFVDAYNKLITTTNTLTGVVKVEGGAPLVGGLVGDSSVRNVLSGLRAELTNTSAGQSGDAFRALADLGITTQKDGKLAIDDTKLTAALENNYDAVGAFITGDNGLMSRLSGRVDGYVKTGGVLQQRIDGLQKTNTDIKEQKLDLEARVAAIQDRLYKQFNAMDSLVSQLRRTSDSLTGALANLPGVVRQGK